MTGFGRGEASGGGGKFTVEIRTVNHRFCDVSVRMPRHLIGLEDRLRRLVAGRVSRGKADVFVTYEEERGAGPVSVTVNMALAEAYMDAASKIEERFGELGGGVTLPMLLQLPDILKIDKGRADEEESWGAMSAAAETALAALAAMRAGEGERLAADIAQKIRKARERLAVVEERAPFAEAEYRQRLDSRIKELTGQSAPDESRIAAEVAIMAERCCIDEEIVRLKSHLDQAEGCCAAGEPAGRKLDFIIQEINRETNTIGSKSGDLIISGAVVDIKSEIEKIREQAQNLE
jgi:uncharacterized protein (TIGR00255 family)